MTRAKDVRDIDSEHPDTAPPHEVALAVFFCGDQTCLGGSVQELRALSLHTKALILMYEMGRASG